MVSRGGNFERFDGIGSAKYIGYDFSNKNSVDFVMEAMIKM